MDEPLPLETYRHFKGGNYEIVCVALDTENPQRKLVVYKSLYDKENFPKGTIWSRELSDFFGFKEEGDKKIKRFERV